MSSMCLKNSVYCAFDMGESSKTAHFEELAACSANVHPHGIEPRSSRDKQRPAVFPSETDVGGSFRSLDGGDLLALGIVDLNAGSCEIQVPPFIERHPVGPFRGDLLAAGE